MHWNLRVDDFGRAMKVFLSRFLILALCVLPSTAVPYWQSVSQQTAGCTDPNWANVLLLLPLDGTDGATTASDVSSYARTLTFANGAALDTAQFKFGTASGEFDGTDSLITVPDSADWDFTGQFTIELFFRVPSISGNAQRTFIAKRNALSSNISWDLSWTSVTASPAITFEFSTNGTTNAHLLTAAGAGLILVDTWYYLAVDRDSSDKMRLYLNNVMISSKTGASGTPFNSTNALSIGARANTGAPNLGWEDEIRITTGVARCGSDAGCAVPTQAFPICQ